MNDPDYWSWLKKNAMMARRKGVKKSENNRNSIRSRYKSRALVPIGSLEQHGPHLPVSTDTVIAEHVSRLVANEIGSLLLPAIQYGVSFEHAPKFHVSFSHTTLSLLMTEICSSLNRHGIEEIVIINGHHGNIGALQYVSQDLEERTNSNLSFPSGVTRSRSRDNETRPVASVPTRVHVLHYWHQLKEAELGHAGEVETSLMLAIAPELVKMENAQASANKLTKSKPAYASILNSVGSFTQITGNGVWGDPKKASAEIGNQLLKEITAGLVNTIFELSC